jgi:hypothetical protein
LAVHSMKYIKYFILRLFLRIVLANLKGTSFYNQILHRFLPDYLFVKHT